MVTDCVERLDSALNEVIELNHTCEDMPDYASLLITYFRDFVTEIKTLRGLTPRRSSQRSCSVVTALEIENERKSKTVDSDLDKNALSLRSESISR